MYYISPKTAHKQIRDAHWLDCFLFVCFSSWREYCKECGIRIVVLKDLVHKTTSQVVDPFILSYILLKQIKVHKF